MWNSSRSNSGPSYGRLPTEDHDIELNHHNSSYNNTSTSSASSSRLILKDKILQQDDHLNILEQSIQRLGTLSLTISDEIKSQNRMLDEMDEDVDEAENRLDFITKQTKELIKKSGGPKYCAIITILSIILVILILLVIYL